MSTPNCPSDETEDTQDADEYEMEQRERHVAMQIWGLVHHLERSKGDIAFSRSQLRLLRRNGHVLEPRQIARYTRGPAGKCLEISRRNLREHPYWSLWIGFALARRDDKWHPHAWNLTPKRYIIEPCEPPSPKLYYGMEVAVGSKQLKHRGFDDKTIEKLNSYAEWFLEGLRPAERRRMKEKGKYRKIIRSTGLKPLKKWTK